MLHRASVAVCSGIALMGALASTPRLLHSQKAPADWQLPSDSWEGLIGNVLRKWKPPSDSGGWLALRDGRTEGLTDTLLARRLAASVGYALHPGVYFNCSKGCPEIYKGLTDSLPIVVLSPIHLAEDAEDSVIAFTLTIARGEGKNYRLNVLGRKFGETWKVDEVVLATP